MLAVIEWLGREFGDKFAFDVADEEEHCDLALILELHNQSAPRIERLAHFMGRHILVCGKWGAADDFYWKYHGVQRVAWVADSTIQSIKPALRVYMRMIEVQDEWASLKVDPKAGIAS